MTFPRIKIADLLRRFRRKKKFNSCVFYRQVNTHYIDSEKFDSAEKDLNFVKDPIPKTLKLK